MRVCSRNVNVQMADKRLLAKPSVRFAAPVVDVHQSTTTDPLSSQAIHDRYFPQETAQRPELDWLQAASSDAEISSAVRFDLAGNVLSRSDISGIGGDRGLHHHGDQPDSAGYTVSDILHLCTSTFAPQRTIMLSLLSKIVRRFDDYGEDVQRRIQRHKLEEAALQLGLSVVCSNERNIGVLREGISCLSASTAEAARGDPSAKSRLAKLPLDALIPKLDKLLEEPVSSSTLDGSSILQVVAIVGVIADFSAAHAAAITSILPALCDSFLAGCTWPVVLERVAIEELAAAKATLEVLANCVQWERENAQTLLKRGVFEHLTRFVAVQPWMWTSQEKVQLQALPCTTLAISIIDSLTRYGLFGSSVQLLTDAMHCIGRWVAELSVVDAGVIALHLGIAYFRLLRTWYICARDAHSMVVEHDLTWSQVNGMPWAEEAMDLVERTVNMEAGADSNLLALLIATAADVVTAKLQGLAANRIVGWQEQQADVAKTLENSGIIDVAAEMLSHAHMLREVSVDLVTALCRLFSETWLLSSLVERAHPDLDMLLQTAVPGTALGLGKGHLGAVLLAGQDKGDIRAWAGQALAILSLLQPGDEALAMRLVDDLLDLAWSPAALERTGHQHGLYILRPFLHYHILPKLDRIVGASYPEPKYLKRTTTLRADLVAVQPPLEQMDEERKSSLGLPLQPDWLLRPLTELAVRKSSAAFTQLPPPWDATDLQLAKTSLLSIKLLRDGAIDLGGFRMEGPAVLRALMQTFMLEARPKDYDEDTEAFHPREEIYRDEGMEGIMEDLAAPYLVPRVIGAAPIRQGDQSEVEGLPGSTSAAAFYQLYEAFIELYESVSFGHKLFGQLLLPPLAMRYATDYRRLFWADHAANLLRPLGGNAFGFDDVLLERGLCADFFEPVEEDEAVLRGYVGAIVTGAVSPSKGQFLFCLAGWHVAHYLWRGTTSEKGSKARAGAIRAIFGPGSRVSRAVTDWLLRVAPHVPDHRLLVAPLDSSAAVAEDVYQERRAAVETHMV